MQYRRVGSSGLKVSVVGFGTWLTFREAMTDDVARACFDRAVAGGINFFDTSDSYARGEAEELLGSFLRGLSRGSFVVATKCFFPTGEGVNERGLSRKHVLEACEGSLRRLGLATIDLYQCHRHDPETPLHETVRAMGDLIRQGKILYWGVSRWAPEELGEAVAIADAMNVPRPISNQTRYNLLDREVEDGVLGTCEREGLGILAYSPLAQGLLAGKYDGSGPIPAGTRASTPGARDWILPRIANGDAARAQRFVRIARDAGIAPARLALLWCLRTPAVATVIAGASRPEQIDDNVRAVDEPVAQDVWERIDAELRG